MPDALYIDLLEFDTYTRLLAHPEDIESYIPPKFSKYIVIAERLSNSKNGFCLRGKQDSV